MDDFYDKLQHVLYVLRGRQEMNLRSASLHPSSIDRIESMGRAQGYCQAICDIEREFTLLKKGT